MIVVIWNEKKQFINLATFLLVSDAAEDIFEGVIHQLTGIFDDRNWFSKIKFIMSDTASNQIKGQGFIVFFITKLVYINVLSLSLIQPKKGKQNACAKF